MIKKRCSILKLTIQSIKLSSRRKEVKIKKKQDDTKLLNKVLYTIEIIRYSDGSFFAHIKEYPECMTEANSFEEVLKMIEDARKSWFEALND